MQNFIKIIIFIILFFSISCTDTISNKEKNTNSPEKDQDIETVSIDDKVTDSENTCSEENLYWIWDFSVMPPKDKQICATIRGEGDYIYILVADDVWQKSVTEKTITNMLEAWEIKTPTSENSGIFQQLTGMFGAIPDSFDNDPKLYLFLYEMDGYSSFTFDGYFKPDDQIDKKTSNKKEMIHINIFENLPDSFYSLSVQAHEFQHLIHWGKDNNEESWLNEAMSEVAMTKTGFGFDEYWVKSWLADTKNPLIKNAPGCDYGILLLFGTYLWERFGENFISEIITDTDNGLISLNKQLSLINEGLDFKKVFADFAIAIALNDTTIDNGKYGFENIEITPPYAQKMNGTKYAVPANGGVTLFKYEGNLNGKTIQIETSQKDLIQLKVAIKSEAGSELIKSELSKSPSEISIGERITETETLWLAVTNPSGKRVEISVVLQ